MQSSRRPIPRILLSLMAVGLLAGLGGVALRYRAEMRNRRVELAVEWQEVAQLAEMSGKSPSEILGRFKQSGVTSVVIPEETFSSLEQNGEIQRLSSPAEGNETRFFVRHGATLQRINKALQVRKLLLENPIAAKTSFVQSEAKPVAVGDSFTSVEYAFLRTIGIGLSPETCQIVKEAGLRITGRISNFPGVTPQSAEDVLKDLKNQGASLVIFQGEEVLGYRGLEDVVGKMFRDPKAPHETGDPNSLELDFGAVEFGKQKGDVEITNLLKGDYVRVHSIQVAEMAQLTEPEIVERYVRAVRDRNIRYCYVRLWTLAGADPIEENIKYLNKIVSGIRKGKALMGGGLDTGVAKRFLDPGIPRLLFGVMGLGIAAGVMAVLQQMFPLSKKAFTGWLLLCCEVCISLSLLGESGRQYVALLAGIAFPTLACLRIFPLASKSFPQGQAMRRAAVAMVFASLITSVGIVLVAGLLATRPYMLHAKQFFGIKVQHIIPLLLVMFVSMTGGILTQAEEGKAFWNRVSTHLRRISQEPARFGVLLLSLLLIAFFAFVVARTGNDAGVGASGIEMKFRNLTERLLFVRPRTKEYLFGHPAMFLGLALWWRGKRNIGLPLFLFGCLGQVSLLNTFCHIHTPLLISFWRNLVGLGLGVLIGGVVLWVWEWCERRFKKPAEANT